MNPIEKFNSDIQKAIKYDRANNGGHYDGKRASESIARIFENSNAHVRGVARQIADYWLGTYILPSPLLNDEPTEANREKISAFFSFLNDGDPETLESISADDWENLRDFVNFEAETLDLDALQSMMGIILDHGAI